MSDNVNFAKTILNRIADFSERQLCQFAWLCGIRVIPFLGARRDFEYWKPDDRQTHLYNIFLALDLSAQFVLHGIKDDLVENVTRAVETAVYSANNSVATYVARTVENAARAIKTEYPYSYAIDAARAAEDAAFEAACDIQLISDTNPFGIKNILLGDIETIKKNGNLKFHSNILIYGELWENFQTDLNKIGYDYWGKLYSDLFSGNFHIDSELLKLRLSIPESMRSLGASDLTAYLKEIENQKAARFNEARIIIVGEKGVGKTSLARKLMNPKAELPKIEESTEGVDVLHWKLSENTDTGVINVRIWDFAGHAITHTAHRYFLAEHCIYIIVYDGRIEQRNNLEYWLNHVKNYGGNSPIYIFVNVRDRSPIGIDENMFLSKFPTIIDDFIYISLLEDTDGIRGFRDKIGNLIRTDSSWDSKIPAKWFTMKEQLEELFSIQQMELITIKDFNALAKKVGINDSDSEVMKRFLHALGVCLWYDKIIDLQTFVLNPGWISYGVYKIINWMGKNRDYKLYMDDLNYIFINEDAKRYPKDKYSFIFDLMRAYELAYPVIEDTKVGLVLPSLLPNLQPEKRMEDAYPVKDSLHMRYKVSGIMPLDTITRFIVHHHNEIVVRNCKQIVWRRGVVLHDKIGNEALIIEDGLEIRISVKGKKALEFFNILRKTLNNIFKGYKSDNPELEYAITETNQHKVIYANDETILAYSMNDRLYLEACTREEINMINIKELYNINDSAIIQGNKNSLINKSSRAIVASNIDLKLPPTVNNAQFTKILEMLEKFLESEQSDELKHKDSRALQKEVIETRKLGYKKGWTRLRDFMTDTANMITITTPALKYIAEHPEIPQVIVSLFTH